MATQQKDKRILDTICIELTAYCPLRCVHCSALASPERMTFVPIEAIELWFSELKELNTTYLSGGEPFAHPDFLDIVQIAARFSTEVVAYTSGTRMVDGKLLPLSVESLRASREAGIDRVDVSLYASMAGLHEAITSTPGSFSATLETARRARAEGLRLGVHFVPIDSAAMEVEKVRQVAYRLGAERFHVLALANQGRAKSRNLSIGPPSHFLSLLRQLSTRQGPDVILSSALRSALDQEDLTPRDQLTPAFIDSRGFVYPGEGHRSRCKRSKLSLLEGNSLLTTLSELNYV